VTDDLTIQVLLEEYRTLRQESLDTLSHRLTVVNFTFAALSVVIAAMLTTPGVPDLVIGLVGVVFVPQAAKAGLFIWLGEYQRSQRAGRHLADLERRINAHMSGGDDEVRLLTWESGLTSKGTHMSTPYIATIAFTLGVGWAGGALGAHHLTRAVLTSLDTAVALPLLGVAAAGVLAWEWAALRRFRAEWARART
jgi:hypothetical protein